jgi:hypothetical protein
MAKRAAHPALGAHERDGDRVVDRQPEHLSWDVGMCHI